MKRIIYIAIVLIIGIPFGLADQVPLGFVTHIELNGVDLQDDRVLHRAQQRMALKLFAPVVAGDEINLQDPKSKIGLTLNNAEVSVTSANSPFAIGGKSVITAEEWQLIKSIGALFGDAEQEQVPDNMVARGGALKIALAHSKVNYVSHGRRKLWFSWQGGRAPFSLKIEFKNAPQIISIINAQDFEIELQQDLPDLVFVSLTDSAGNLHRFRLRTVVQTPEPPAAIGETVYAKAVWLMAQSSGQWTFEAVQMLRDARSDAAYRFAEKISRGIKPE